MAVALLVPPPWQLAHLASVLTGSAPGTAPSPCGMEPACLSELSGQAPDAEVGVTEVRGQGVMDRSFLLGYWGSSAGGPSPTAPAGHLELCRARSRREEGAAGTARGHPGCPQNWGPRNLLSTGYPRMQGSPGLPETPLRSLASQGSPLPGSWSTGVPCRLGVEVGRPRRGPLPLPAHGAPAPGLRPHSPSLPDPQTAPLWSPFLNGFRAPPTQTTPA